MSKVRALQVVLSVATIAISTAGFVDVSFAAKGKSINVTGSQANAGYGHADTSGGSVSANKSQSKSTGAGGKATASSGGLYAGYANTEKSAQEGTGPICETDGAKAASIVNEEGGASESSTAFTLGVSGSETSAKSGKKSNGNSGSSDSGKSGKKNK